MTAETATEATRTNKRPRPSANMPLLTSAAYVCVRRCTAIFARTFCILHPGGILGSEAWWCGCFRRASRCTGYRGNGRAGSATAGVVVLHRLWPLDGLRGVPVLADPGVLAGIASRLGAATRASRAAS